MFNRVLNTPLHANEEKKNLSLLKTLKTPNFKRRNETKTEKDHNKNQLQKQSFCEIIISILFWHESLSHQEKFLFYLEKVSTLWIMDRIT